MKICLVYRRSTNFLLPLCPSAPVLTISKVTQEDQFHTFMNHLFVCWGLMNHGGFVMRFIMEIFFISGRAHQIIRKAVTMFRNAHPCLLKGGLDNISRKGGSSQCWSELESRHCPVGIREWKWALCILFIPSWQCHSVCVLINQC